MFSNTTNMTYGGKTCIYIHTCTWKTQHQKITNYKAGRRVPVNSPSTSWKPGMSRAFLSATGAQWLEEAMCTQICFSLLNVWTLSLILLGIQEILYMVNNAQGILEFAKIGYYTWTRKNLSRGRRTKYPVPITTQHPPLPAKKVLVTEHSGLVWKTRNLYSYVGHFYEFLNLVTQCSLTFA